jgi:hypothetical protein
VHPDAPDRIARRRGSADVLIRQPAARHAGNQRRHVVGGTARRNVVDDFAVDDALPFRVLYVDDRRLAGDGDRFFERADAHLGVNLGGERACQHDAFALHRVEAAEREGHGVGAGHEIDDLKLAATVADRRADLFDQGGTCRLDRHPGQDRP